LRLRGQFLSRGAARPGYASRVREHGDSSTRTSEPIPALLAQSSARRIERSAAETAVPEAEDPERAAVSFALERERALRRSDHLASVQRLNQALSFGVVLWLGSLLLDWWTIQFSHENNLRYFLLLRAIGAVAILAAIWRLRRPEKPSPRALAWIDVGVFTLTSFLVSLMAVQFRGITSPYAQTFAVILVARGAAAIAPWQRGAWLFAIPALAFPVTMLAAAQLDAKIAAQFRDPEQAGTFGITLCLIAMIGLLLTLGGNFAWRSRLEALEMRTIGRYKLERRLGYGGMAQVWAAYDSALKHRVALKTVSGHRPGSLALARLEREVRALAELTHPNTVRVFDYGVTEDGLWYYAMELLHGENLRDLVTREGPLPTARLVHLARQILRALGEAHAKGIVHRDIKPENVFVAQLGGESDIAKLLDFGIAKAMRGDETLTNTGWIAGTPAYMPPEVIQGRGADVRSDIYCMGITLYFAASGQLPFSDTTHMGLLAAHLNSEPMPLSLACEAPVPPLLEQIVERCMAKNPDHRYASTQELLEALAALG
jgi:serine/threonine-protein kinase